MRTSPETHRPALPANGAGEALASYPDVVLTDYLHVRDYFRIVYRRRWLIAGMMALGLLGAVAYNWQATRLFQARTTLQFEGDPNILALDRPVFDQRDWMREFVPTQLGILTSRDIARMTHEQLKASNEALPPEQRLRNVPTVGEILIGRSVDSIKDTRLITVDFRSTDPVIAARTANAIARAYTQRNFELRARTTGEASEWLSQQVAEQRRVLEASETALQRYREQHGADALFADRLGTEHQNIVVQKLAELQGAASKARMETIDKEAQYRQLLALQADQVPVDTLPAIASNFYIQGLKRELIGLQRELVQKSDLGERHPDFIKLQGAVQATEQKVQAEISNVVRSIRNDFEAAQARERALTAALERQKAEVQALNRKAVEYTALEREAVTNREVVDKLLQRTREASLARALQTTNISVVEAAETPSRPFFPRQTRNIGIGLVGSGALALTLVFLLEIFNTRVTSPDDVKRHLQIQVLGVTPLAKPQNGHGSLLLGDGAPSTYTELIQAVRTNLLLAPQLASSRTLLVTSSEPREGKTLTAANLAIAFSRLNQRVLLIDADLRKPRLHDMFGEEQQPGLTDVLKGSATTTAFRKTKVGGLWLLPSGKPSRNPADLLGSERFRKLIEMFQKQFDWVVLDSPPVLAVTDPCLIAPTASGVLFVVGCGRTSREVAAAAVERLDAAGGQLVGAVLNGVLLEQANDSYLPYFHRDYQAYYIQQDGSSWLPELPDAPAKGRPAGNAPVVEG